MTDNNAGQLQEICAVQLFSLKILTMHIFNESFFWVAAISLRLSGTKHFVTFNLSGVKSEYAVERLRSLNTRGL